VFTLFPLCRHETSSGYYRVSAYFLAKVITDLLIVRLVPLLLFSAISYYMIGKEWSHQWKYCREETGELSSFLISICGIFCRFSACSLQVLHLLPHLGSDRSVWSRHSICLQCSGQCVCCGQPSGVSGLPPLYGENHSSSGILYSLLS